MAKDHLDLSDEFLDSLKLTKAVLKSQHTLVSGAIGNAILSGREGDNAKCAYWIDHAVEELKEARVVSDASLKNFKAKVEKFVKKHSAISYKDALKKRAGQIAKITTGVFRKKGAAAAQAEAQKLHQQMVKAGEFPDGRSFEDFELALSKSFRQMPRFSTSTANVLKQINFAKIMSDFKLPKTAEKDLKLLAADMIKQGPYNPKSAKSAKAILSAAGNTKSKPLDLTTALDDQVINSLI